MKSLTRACVMSKILRAFDMKEPVSAGPVILLRLSKGNRASDGVLLIFVPGISGLFVDWPWNFSLEIQ